MSTIKTDKIIPIGLTLTVEGSAVFTAGIIANSTMSVGGVAVFGAGISANSTMSVGGAVTATSFAGNGTIPIGGIIMWSGAVANIPTDWALCNGLNGTPDLRGRFVIGATSGTGAGYTAGSVGGTANSIVVSHTHGFTGYRGQGDGPGQFYDAFYSNQDGAVNTTPSTFTSHPTGSSGVNANIPPYHALAYIMRVA